MKFRMKAEEIAGLLVLLLTATFVGIVLGSLVLAFLFFGGH